MREKRKMKVFTICALFDFQKMYSRFISVCRPTNGNPVSTNDPEKAVKCGWFMSDIWCDDSESWSKSDIRSSHAMIDSFVYKGASELLENKNVIIASPKHKNFTGDDRVNLVIKTLFDKEVFGDYSIFVQGIADASSSQYSGAEPAEEMINLCDEVSHAIFMKSGEDIGFRHLALETPFCGIRKFDYLDHDLRDDYTFQDWMKEHGYTRHSESNDDEEDDELLKETRKKSRKYAEERKEETEEINRKLELERSKKRAKKK